MRPYVNPSYTIRCPPKQVIGDMHGFYGTKLYSDAFIEPLKYIGEHFRDHEVRANLKKRWLNTYFDAMERILIGEYHDCIELPKVIHALKIRIDVSSIPSIDNLNGFINVLAVKHLEMIAATLGYMVVLGIATKATDVGSGGIFSTDYQITDFDIGTGIIKFERLD